MKADDPWVNTDDLRTKADDLLSQNRRSMAHRLWVKADDPGKNGRSSRTSNCMKTDDHL